MKIKNVTKKNIKLFDDSAIAKFKEHGITIKVNVGDLTIEYEGEDAYEELKAGNVITAMAEGGVPTNIAFQLFTDDNILKTIDLEDYFSSPKDLRRVMGRIIGTHGRTKLIIEEITETDVQITGNKIYIIGNLEGVELASEAINALIRGAPHKKVYHLLESKRRNIKESNLRLWKERYE